MSISSERRASLFRKTERDLLKLSSNQEPEPVHRFRTSVRRLQTLLEEFVPEPARKQKKLLKMLGQIRKCAGKVRDLDVQLAALRSLKIPQEPRRKTRLTHNLIELRAKHEKQLRKLLTKDDIRDIQKRLKRTLKEITGESSTNPLFVGQQMLAQVNRPAGALTQDVLHQYRVAVKRARYAAELAPQSAEATQFIAQMKRLQDAIGDWHDWLTLTLTSEARIGHVHHSSLVAALRNVTAGKFRRAAAALSGSAMPSTTPVSTSDRPRKLNSPTPPMPAKTDSAA
jgi:CHAD domain-containing protein